MPHAAMSECVGEYGTYLKVTPSGRLSPTLGSAIVMSYGTAGSFKAFVRSLAISDCGFTRKLLERYAMYCRGGIMVQRSSLSRWRGCSAEGSRDSGTRAWQRLVASSLQSWKMGLDEAKGETMKLYRLISELDLPYAMLTSR
jgi:hypothetical protein